MDALRALVCLVLGCYGLAARAELPPVPVPAENPITESKRILGKILFWDEQLSSDDSVACGTCHRPAAGGADPRAGLNPGSLPGTTDDVFGSPGIRRLDNDGLPVVDPVFGDAPQVMRRR
jgi:cytochrome c peroxidase